MKNSPKVLLLLVGLAAYSSANFFTDQRLCPDGYFYAGDDFTTPDNYPPPPHDHHHHNPHNHESDNLESLGWEEEIGESPQYSCYKIVDIQFDQQTENLTKVPYQFTFNAAVDTCGDVKGSLPVSLNGTGEMIRVHKLLHDKGHFNHSTFLTSAIYSADIAEWMWLGTNVTLNTTLLNLTESDLASKPCLAATFYVESPESRDDYMVDHRYTFTPTGCNARQDLQDPDIQYDIRPLAICEVRVVTVTYLTWFYTNWMAFLLVILTVLLLTGLCVTVFKHKSGRTHYANRRVYRADARSTADMGPHRDLPAYDEPPTYSDVTGIVTQETKMDKYKNKGKEILAKVTYYRNTTLPKFQQN